MSAEIGGLPHGIRAKTETCMLLILLEPRLCALTGQSPVDWPVLAVERFLCKEITPTWVMKGIDENPSPVANLAAPCF